MSRLFSSCTIAAAILILAACVNPIQENSQNSPSPAGSAGTVRVVLPGGAEETSARTLLPSFTGVTFTLTFTSDDYPNAVTKTISGKGSDDIPLEPGIWNLKVEAKVQGALIANGEAGPIFVQSGKTISAGVILKPVDAESGAGTFDYTVTFPADASAANLTLVSFPQDVTVKDVNLKNQASDTLQEIPAGYYRVIVSLTKGTGNETKIAGKSDIVHIYKEQTTVLEWTFGASDFSDKRSYFTSIDDLEAYLATQPQNTAAQPYTVKLRVNMADLLAPTLNNSPTGTYTDPLGKLYRALHGRFVHVDMSDSVGDIPNGNMNIGSILADQRANQDRIVKLTLPSTLKRIGNTAFYGSNLVIEYPASLEELGNSVFYNSPMSSYDFSGTNLTKIGSSVFYGSSASSINLGSHLTDIGASAFGNCVYLTAITIPKTVTTIGSSIFAYSGNLTSVTTATGTGPLTIQDGFWMVEEGGVKTLVAYTPPAANPPATLTIPAGVTVIGESVFASNAVITSVTLPAGLKKIGNRAFQTCNNLETINFPDTLESIGDYAIPAKPFDGSDVTFPASLKELGDYAFGGTNTSGTTFGGNKLRKADLSQTKLTHIGNYAFANCPNLVEVVLPNTLKSIGNYAFFRSLQLGNITFPASLETIGDFAFACATSGAMPGANVNNARTQIDLSTTKVASIGANAFNHNRAVVLLSFPATLKSIGTYAFGYISGIPSLVFPASLESIGDYAFMANSSMGGYNTTLTEVTFSGANVVFLGNQIFTGCTKIAKFNVTGSGTLSTDTEGRVLIVKGVLVTAVYDFNGTITIPEGVTEIRGYAFGTNNAAVSSQVTEVIMPVSLVSFDDKSYPAFYGTPNLASVTFPPGCNLKNSRVAFINNCTALTTLDLTNTKLETITGLVSGTTALESITLPATVKSMGYSVLTGGANLETVTIRAVNPPTATGTNTTFTVPGTVTAIQVPSGSVDAYKTAPQWSDHADKIVAIP